MAKDVNAAGPAPEGVTGWWGHLLAIVATGLLLSLSFPYPGWGWLGFVAVGPLCWLAVRSARPRLLLGMTYCLATLWWVIMLRWMYPVTVGGTVALCFYIGLYWPVGVLAIRAISRAWKLPLALALPMVWVSLELVRGWILAGGLGWYMIAHTQAPFRPEQGTNWLVQTAELFGELTVSFLVLAVTGALVDVVIARQARKGTDGRGLVWRAVAGGAIAGVLTAGGLTYGALRLRQVEGSLEGEPALRIAVVQTNVSQDNKRFPTKEQLLNDWQNLLDLTREAVSGTECDMVLWPETVTPAAINDEAVQLFLQQEDGRAVFRLELQKLLAEIDTPILVGTGWRGDFRRVSTPDGTVRYHPDLKYNSAMLLAPQPPLVRGRYDKIHRVPFGEYIPWVDRWPWLKQQFMRYLSPYEVDYTIDEGQTQTVFELPAADPGFGRPVRFIAPICYEDVVGRLTRQMAYEDGEKEAQFLLNLTNDAWYAGTHQPVQHLQIATFRSIELRVPTARSVNTGVSAFIDAAGRIGPWIEVNRADTMVHEMRRCPLTSVYGVIGPWPMIIMASLTGLLTLGGMLRLRRQRSRTTA